jgi:hypothetical protein
MQPYFDPTRKTTLIKDDLKKMENDLNKIEDNLKKNWKTPNKKMEDDLKKLKTT